MPTATCRVVSPLVFFSEVGLGRTLKFPLIRSLPVLPGKVWYLLAGPAPVVREGCVPGSLSGLSCMVRIGFQEKTGLPAQQLYGLLALSPEGAEAWGLLLPSLTLGCWAWIPLGPMMLACFLSLPAISLWAQEAQLGIQDQLAFQASVSCQAPVSCPCELAWACMVH